MNPKISRNHPFRRKLLLQDGLIRSMFGRKNPANAIVELNNALAAAENVQDITHDAVAQTTEKYRTDIHQYFRPLLESAYGPAGERVFR